MSIAPLNPSYGLKKELLRVPATSFGQRSCLISVLFDLVAAVDFPPTTLPSCVLRKASR
jgi:hypothetical protein